MAEWKVDISRGRRSFPFAYGIRLQRQDEAEWLVWHSKVTVAQREPVWTGINYQSVHRRAGEQARSPKLHESCWQITSEILSMNARGRTPLALTLATAEIQNRVHLMSRLELFMSAQSWLLMCAAFSCIRLLTGHDSHNYVLVSSQVTFNLSTNHMLEIYFHLKPHYQLVFLTMSFKNLHIVSLFVCLFLFF